MPFKLQLQVGIGWESRNHAGHKDQTPLRVPQRCRAHPSSPLRGIDAETHLDHHVHHRVICTGPVQNDPEEIEHNARTLLRISPEEQTQVNTTLRST